MSEPPYFRPSVPNSGRAHNHGGGQASNTAKGAKNLLVRTVRLCNLNLITNNARTLSSEGSLAALLEEPSDIKWDIIWLSEVRMPAEGFKAFTSGQFRAIEVPKKGSFTW